MVGIPDFTIHDLRHHFAVTMARVGLPLHLLQKQLGHRHIDVTMKYAAHHPAYGDVAAYFTAVGEKLTGNARGRSRGHPPAEEPAARVG